MAKKKKNKTNKKAKKGTSFLLRSLKWLIVLGLWSFIALSFLVAWYAAELPQMVKNPQFERRAAITVLDGEDKEVARYGELKGVSVTIDELPPYLPSAVMAVEDRRFYQHFGIDPLGLARAMARNLKEGRVVQGGSTITQQLAKNLFLSRERTLKRKIQEAILAVWLEHELTKDEILTAYLNRVYLGAGAYGVNAASRTYFNKDAKNLSLYESALLAGLLKAPSRYSPQSNPALAARRAKIVLAAMVDAGYITAEQAKTQSLKAQATLSKPSVDQGERYFTDWITSNLSDLIGNTERDLTIETTFDPAIQRAAEQALAETLRQSEDKNVTQGAIIVMARNGAILAMVGGADYNQSQFNRATQAKRPPGSAFKPFVFLAALEEGWKPYRKILDAPMSEGKYHPENFDGEYFDEVTLTDALIHSLNTAAVRLMDQVGIGNVIALAHKMGIKTKLNRDLSLALGSSGVPLLEMVAAYGAISNGGMTVTPYAITRIADSDNQLLYIRTDIKRSTRAAGRRETGELRDMMRQVIETGTGQRAQIPFEAAGKTGTSQDFRDAWFIGFTDRYITGVWLGNDDNSAMKGVTGGSLPADIWRATMLAAHRQNNHAYTPPQDEENSEGFFSVLRGIFNQ